VSGSCDSIRERRARESWENGGREETTKTTSLVTEVVRRFSDCREQILVLEKICTGRLSLEYLTWNGVVDRVDDLF
jgi:predicted MarR family transcription regulator